MLKFQIFILILSLIECLAVAFIIIVRCTSDAEMDQCSDLHGKSLSFLLAWKWMKPLSSVFLGGVSFLNILFAFFLLYPKYKYREQSEYWYIWFLRLLHAVGFSAVAFIGVFDLKDYKDLHLQGAVVLFVMLCVENTGLLFVPQNICNIQKLIQGRGSSRNTLFIIQIIHSQLCWVFALMFWVTNIGLFEWISIWCIVLYANWFSRDHWDDRIEVMVEPGFKYEEEMSEEMSTLVCKKKLTTQYFQQVRDNALA